MEQILAFLYHGFGVLLFCIAVTLLLNQFGELYRVEKAAKKELYNRPVLYSRLTEE